MRCVPVLVAGLLLLGVFAGPVPATGGPAHRSTLAAVNGTLQIGPYVAHPYDGFWSVNVNGGDLLNATLDAEFNATPFVLVRFGAEVDATNLSADCTYTNSGLCQPADMNFPEFKTFCDWVHCHAVLGVPAETNDPGLAALTVQYIESTIGLRPAFWSIGNEPEGWTHWAIPFAHWTPSDHSTPTPAQFALETVNFTRAIRSVDPSARIIGDQDAQQGSAHAFLHNVSRYDGANLSAVAFHSYPGHDGPASPSVAQFLSATNINRTTGDYEGDLAAADAGCNCSLPVMIGEFNGAQGGTDGPYMLGYPDVPMTAAVASLALTDNVAVFGFFSFLGAMPFDLLNSSGNTATPTFDLYAQLLRYLPMGSTYAANVSTTLKGVYAVEEVNNTSQAGLLVVSTNTTLALNLSLGTLLTASGGTVLSDTPGGGLTSRSYANGTGPGNVTLEPEEVALFLPGEVHGATGGRGGTSTGGGPGGGGGGGGSGGGGSGAKTGASFPVTEVVIGVAVALAAAVAVLVLLARPRRRRGSGN